MKLLAEQYHLAKPKGLIVFISAEPSIVPLPSFQKYSDTKKEAENFLREFCSNLDVVIVRPGLVYSSYDRGWTMPLAALSTVTS